MPDIYVADEKAKKPPAPKTLGEKIKKELKEELKILKKKPQTPFSALLAQPKNLRFETQQKQEEIILLLRRHPVTNFSWIVTGAVLVLLPFVFNPLVLLNFLSKPYQIIGLLIWYLLTFAYTFEKFLTWFFNVNLITDERIVDIDFNNILYKNITETKIDQVQDVNIIVGGFVRSLFNFGDVTIQTAGAQPEICFEAVPNPEQVSKILNKLIQEEEQERIEGRVR